MLYLGDLLHRLKIYGGTEEYIEQLIPTSIPISKIKVDMCFSFSLSSNLFLFVYFFSFFPKLFISLFFFPPLSLSIYLSKYLLSHSIPLAFSLSLSFSLPTPHSISLSLSLPLSPHIFSLKGFMFDLRAFFMCCPI